MHQRRPPELRDDVGHGEGLARAGHAQQGLVRQAVLDALDQLGDGLRLVAGGLRNGWKQTERAIGEGDEHEVKSRRRHETCPSSTACYQLAI